MRRAPIGPDDPRHGTQAGYLAHLRDDQEPCDPCRRARYLAHKAGTVRRARGIYGRIPISPEAWHLITTTSRLQLAELTGVTPGALGRIERRGPTATILRTTHEAILRATGRTVTPIGLQRRLRALSFLGWPMREIADRYPGGEMDALKQLRRASKRCFVTLALTHQIVAAYKDLSMTPAPPSAAAAQTRTLAQAAGYFGPFAWDEDTIDDPEAKPFAGAADDEGVDEQAVYRRMHGDRVKLSKADQFALIHRCLDANWEYAEIERVTGLHPFRLLREEAAKSGAETDGESAEEGNEAA